jgi:hypothetical protein
MGSKIVGACLGSHELKRSTMIVLVRGKGVGA